MQVYLSRKVKLEQYHLLMNINVKTERKHIVAVLKCAKECGTVITPKNLCDHLIRRRPVSVGTRIIQRCVDRGLMEWIDNNKSAKITKQGFEAIETDKVPENIRDAYELVYVCDQLIPQVIDCIPLKNIDVEVDENNRIKGDKLQQKVHFPEEYKKLLLNKEYTLFGKGREVIKITDIGPWCKKGICNKKVQLDVIIDSNNKIRKTIKGDYSDVLPQSSVDFKSIFLSILDIMGQDKWNANTGKIRIAFSELKSDREKEEFISDISLKDISIDGLGNFEHGMIKNVPIEPISIKDAHEWAIWLLEKRITNYVTLEMYDELIKEIEAHFPEFSLQLPTRIDLAKMIKSKSRDEIPEAYWYIKAPMDLVVEG